jgi:RES domain-containing protein
MMVYRLAKQAYINDLSGKGAEITGGRWNSKGIAIVYTSGSRALAAIEIAVHTPLGIIPRNYWILSIELPDNIEIKEIQIDELSKTWNGNPFIHSTQFIGDDFINAQKHLIMRVPSATVKGDFNYLVNPQHPDFKHISIKASEPFDFDSRLFKK